MPVIWYKSVCLGTLGLGKQLDTTTNERDGLELCRINSEIAVPTVLISERLGITKEERAAVDTGLALSS